MDLISPDHYMTLSEDANASFGGRQRKPREKNRGLQVSSRKSPEGTWNQNPPTWVFQERY